MKLDTECISHTGDVNKVTKLFKLACIGYQSSDLLYRNVVIKKDHQIRLRKFLAGQCMFMVKESERLS